MLMLAAAILIGSYAWGPTRAMWDVVDAAVFYRLNGTLAWGGKWTEFWAVANWRPFDAIAGAAILALVIAWIRTGRMDQVAARCAITGGLCVTVLLSSVIVKEFIEAANLQRHGPSEELPGAILLGDVVTWIDAKDTSNHSFPGDHGAVLLVMAMMLTLLANRRLAIAAWIILMPFTLPRLVAGAHWLTDVVVGGGMLMLITLAVWFTTPLGANATLLGTRIIQPMLDLVIPPQTNQKDPEAISTSGPE